MKPRPTKTQVQARVSEILRIRLDGAEFWDLCEYVREKEQEEGSPWKLAEGQKPLSDSQLWRYIAKADREIAASCRASRKKLLRRHLAQRRSLYAKAVSAGDYRAALACLQDEAKLLGLDKRDTDLPEKQRGPTIQIGLFARVEQYLPVLRQLQQPAAAGGRSATTTTRNGDGDGIPAGPVPGQRLRELLAEAPANGEAEAVPVPDLP
jgi:hypothetical protein